MMSNRGHNKKRNAGLLYEFLVRAISSALVSGDQKKSSTALKILKRYFKPGTELYREFRLINALVRTTVSSDAVAMSIITEAKKAALSTDHTALDRQKSLLIRNINHALGDSEFWDRPVQEYRTYATVQTLLNDWRAPTTDISRAARYEDQLVAWLTGEKPANDEQIVMNEGPGTSRLLMKVLMQKLNDKYSGVLNEAQKALIRSYAWSAVNDKSDAIKMKLEEVKSSLLNSIVEFKVMYPENEYVCSQLDEAAEKLQMEDLQSVDDETVARFMLYIKLHEELTVEDKSDG